MSPIVVAIFVAMGAAPVVAALGWRRGRTRVHAAVLVAVVAVSATWFVFVRLVALDYNDADGFGDCGSHCSSWQETVRWVLVLAPVVALALSAAAIVFLRWANRATR